MNTKTRSDKRNRLILPTILCVTSLLLNSCTTQSTAYDVQTQPMTVDLEKQVLKETGLSGMAIGAITGAAAGALFAGVLTKVSGGSADQVKTAVIAGGAAGLLAGGYKGWQKGQQKGQEMVTASMGRDKMDQLLTGARAQNQQLENYNSGLRKRIADVKKLSDPKEKKLAYEALKRQSNKKLIETNDRIAMRNKALDNKEWDANQKEKYRAEEKDLVCKRDNLVASMDQMSKLEQAVVY